MSNRLNNITILIVDDDPDDRLLAQEAFEETDMTQNLRFVADGEELLEYLHNREVLPDGTSVAPLPSLILLDLNMPRRDGREVLREIKNDPRLRYIPIIILSTSDTDADIWQSYQLGASSYITKPTTFEGFINFIKNFRRYWMEVAILPTNPMEGG